MEWVFPIRDRKEGYDVSVPFRAGGYMSMLGFEKTPDEEGLLNCGVLFSCHKSNV